MPRVICIERPPGWLAFDTDQQLPDKTLGPISIRKACLFICSAGHQGTEPEPLNESKTFVILVLNNVSVVFIKGDRLLGGVK